MPGKDTENKISLEKNRDDGLLEKGIKLILGNDKKLFDQDGAVVSFLTKTGELIILNILWILLCIPVMTFVSSSVSMYYAVVKSIRRGRGYPVREFLASVRRTAAKGIGASVGIVVWGYLLYRLCLTAYQQHSTQGSFLLRVYTVIIVLTLSVLIYFFPVMSRFTMSVGGCLRLSLLMALRHIGITAVLVLGMVVIGWLMIFRLPVVLIIVVPSVWCLICSFLMERVLKIYMQKPTEETKDEWYYED